MRQRYCGQPFTSCPASSQRMYNKEKSLAVTVGILGNSGQSSREWFSKRQIRHGRRVTSSIGGVRGVSSLCFPLSSILTGSTGDGEVDRVAYAATELSSSSVLEEGGGGKGEEEGGMISSSVSRVWQTRSQSCCTRYSAMIARGMT